MWREKEEEEEEYLVIHRFKKVERGGKRKIRRWRAD